MENISMILRDIIELQEFCRSLFHIRLSLLHLIAMQLLNPFPTTDNNIPRGFERVLPDLFFLPDMVLYFLYDAIEILHGMVRLFLRTHFTSIIFLLTQNSGVFPDNTSIICSAQIFPARS